jgi:hypothetical protein
MKLQLPLLLYAVQENTYLTPKNSNKTFLKAIDTEDDQQQETHYCWGQNQSKVNIPSKIILFFQTSFLQSTWQQKALTEMLRQ